MPVHRLGIVPLASASRHTTPWHHLFFFLQYDQIRDELAAECKKLGEWPRTSVRVDGISAHGPGSYFDIVNFGAGAVFLAMS